MEISKLKKFSDIIHLEIRNTSEIVSHCYFFLDETQPAFNLASNDDCIIISETTDKIGKSPIPNSKVCLIPPSGIIISKIHSKNPFNR